MSKFELLPSIQSILIFFIRGFMFQNRLSNVIRYGTCWYYGGNFIPIPDSNSRNCSVLILNYSSIYYQELSICHSKKLYINQEILDHDKITWKSDSSQKSLNNLSVITSPGILFKTFVTIHYQAIAKHFLQNFWSQYIA